MEAVLLRPVGNKTRARVRVPLGASVVIGREHFELPKEKRVSRQHWLVSFNHEGRDGLFVTSVRAL